MLFVAQCMALEIGRGRVSVLSQRCLVSTVFALKEEMVSSKKCEVLGNTLCAFRTSGEEAFALSLSIPCSINPGRRPSSNCRVAKLDLIFVYLIGKVRQCFSKQSLKKSLG